MKCKNCNSQNSEKAKFCVKCGNKLDNFGKSNSAVNTENTSQNNGPVKYKTKECPYCNKQIGVESTLCLYCGKKLADKQEKSSDDHEKPSALNSNLPSQPVSVNIEQRGAGAGFDIPLNRVILFICGVLGIIGFFTPFYGLEEISDSITVSGYGMVKLIYRFLSVASQMGLTIGDLFENVLGPMVKQSGASSESAKQTMSFLVGLFIVTGPILFGVFSLVILLKTFSGNGFGLGLTTFILYTIVSFILVAVLSSELKLDVSFFTFTSTGYWLTMVAMIGGGVATIFE